MPKLHFELTDFINSIRAVIWCNLGVFLQMGLHLIMMIKMFVLYIFIIKCSLMLVCGAMHCVHVFYGVGIDD